MLIHIHTRHFLKPYSSTFKTLFIPVPFFSYTLKSYVLSSYLSRIILQYTTLHLPQSKVEKKKTLQADRLFSCSKEAEGWKNFNMPKYISTCWSSLQKDRIANVATLPCIIFQILKLLGNGCCRLYLSQEIP